MTIHKLKIWPVYFNCTLAGIKPFEVRKNDRGFKIGDTLILEEYDPKSNKGYTGKKASRVVSYVLPGGQFGIKAGYCVLGLVSPVDSHNWQIDENLTRR